MLNLNKSIVDQYWQKTAPRIAKVLSVMEGFEFWLVDDVKSVNDALRDLARKLDKSSHEKLSGNAEKLLFIMAYMSSGRALRMMSWFDERFPKGLSVDLLQEARRLGEVEHGRLMIDRLQTIDNLKLINRVFAPNRTRLIHEIIKKEHST